MQAAIDETHDPAAASWVARANAAETDFPLQNLPFAIFREKSTRAKFRGGVAIGDQILDLAAVFQSGGLGDAAAPALQAACAETLNALMTLGPSAWSPLRHALFAALRRGSPHEARLRPALLAQEHAEYALPATIGDYTDFYTSLHHATAVGRLFRPENPLMPNYKFLPVAYHGRSSSVVISGHPIRRPAGQCRAAGAESPSFAPSARLDYELELGFFIGPGNALGHPIPITDAESHIFGACILNDWSARDIQAWEYQPLGPFLGKNFATSISPWIVTMAALAPFRTTLQRDTAPLPHLAQTGDTSIDITLDVALQSATMAAPQCIGVSNFRHAYWSIAQMVAHHTSNGCNLRSGDLLGTGTLSGPEPHQAGALLETTAGGASPVTLPNGETRIFLEDNDTVIMRAWCTRPGRRRIGFGACTGTIMPAGH